MYQGRDVLRSVALSLLWFVILLIGSAAGLSASSRGLAWGLDRSCLVTVNPDSNSVSVVGVSDRQVRAEISVGVDPRTVAVESGGRLTYVADYGSRSVTVIDLLDLAVVATVKVGERPYGLVVNPDGSRLFVSEQGVDLLRVLDTASLETLALFPTPDRPSGLALSMDGNTLYLTHLLLPFITVFDGVGGPIESIEMSRIELWPDSNLLQSIVFSPDGSTAYVPHTRSNTANRALTFDTTVFPLVSLIDLGIGTHRIGAQLDLGTLDPPGVGLPFDAAVTPDGKRLWVVNAASNDLSILDLETRMLAGHIEVEDNPRAIVLSPDGATAYVNNTLAGTVSVIDTESYTVIDSIPVTDIPLPPILLTGKRLFHSSDDPRMAKAQWIACNTCHFEGEHDGRTWTFGFAGPRNTTGLFGMIETYPLRWSGEWDESADSEFAVLRENFGAGLMDGDMHCQLFPPDCVGQPPNQGRNYDLDALAAFIDSLRVPLSLTHVRGEPLADAELRGQALFSDPIVGCAQCHPGPLYTDLKMHDVGTATSDERIGPAFDTPTLRGLYDSAPYFHDGSATTLFETLTFPSENSEHDVRAILTAAEIDDLLAFLLALPFE
jgi:YVTN family beta-propeller protein